MTVTSLRSRAVAHAAETSRSRPNPARSAWSTSLTLAAMSLGYGVVQLDVTIVNTALGSIGSRSAAALIRTCKWVVAALTPSRLPPSS